MTKLEIVVSLVRGLLPRLGTVPGYDENSIIKDAFYLADLIIAQNKSASN